MKSTDGKCPTREEIDRFIAEKKADVTYDQINLPWDVMMLIPGIVEGDDSHSNYGLKDYWDDHGLYD